MHDWAALSASTGVVGGGRATKVNSVCDLMSAAISARGDPKLRACMVLTFVRRHPPRVEEALKHLQDAEEEEISQSLEVLMGLVDPNDVWDASLGLYDLTLAAHVARVSDKVRRKMPHSLCIFWIIFNVSMSMHFFHGG